MYINTKLNIQNVTSLTFDAPLDIIFMEKFINHYNRFCDKTQNLFQKQKKHRTLLKLLIITASVLYFHNSSIYEKEYNIASKLQTVRL